MKNTLFVLCILLAVVNRTLAEPTQVAEEPEEWQLAVKFRYEMSALTRFLEDTIAATPVVEGIDLTKSRRGERWVVEGRSMYSGDWVFQVSPPRSKLFTLTYLIEGSDRRVVLSCVRENESRNDLAAISWSERMLENKSRSSLWPRRD
jgi:hypothetical protein